VAVNGAFDFCVVSVWGEGAGLGVCALTSILPIVSFLLVLCLCPPEVLRDIVISWVGAAQSTTECGGM